MKALEITKNYKLFLMGAILVVLVAGAFAYKTKKSTALELTGFGGYVASVTVCTCSANPTYYVSLGPPTGGELALTETSEPFAYYDVWGTTGSFVDDTWVNEPSGPWVLGSYTPGGSCLMMGEPCYPLPVTGTISMYGTSLGSAIVE